MSIQAIRKSRQGRKNASIEQRFFVLKTMFAQYHGQLFGKRAMPMMLFLISNVSLSFVDPETPILNAP